MKTSADSETGGLTTSGADGSTSEVASDGSTSEVVTDGDGSTSEVVTGGTGAGTEADSFGDTEVVPSALEGCELAEPCDTVAVWCDHDGCASAMPDDVTVCAWQQLRDGGALRMRVIESYTGDLNKVAAVVGDPARTVLLDTVYNKQILRRCELAAPAFFQGCIDDPAFTDDCYQTDAWFVDCEEVPALACP